MTSHAYPTAALVGDYGRAALGLGLVVLPLATVQLASWTALLLGGLAALFAMFALRTATRHASRITVDEAGIAAAGPLPTRLDWDALDEVKLAFYATKRDGGNGWMQLALRGRRRRLTIDSRIENFDAILRAAAAAARARGVKVSRATAANFAAFGLELEAR
jgi:hypothetical protein